MPLNNKLVLFHCSLSLFLFVCTVHVLLQDVPTEGMAMFRCLCKECLYYPTVQYIVLFIELH